MMNMKKVMVGLLVMGAMVGCEVPQEDPSATFNYKQVPVTVVYEKDEIEVEYNSSTKNEKGTNVTIKDETGKVIFQKNGVCKKQECEVEVPYNQLKNKVYTGEVKLKNGNVGEFYIHLPQRTSK